MKLKAMRNHTILLRNVQHDGCMLKHMRWCQFKSFALEIEIKWDYFHEFYEISSRIDLC